MIIVRQRRSARSGRFPLLHTCFAQGQSSDTLALASHFPLLTKHLPATFQPLSTKKKLLTLALTSHFPLLTSHFSTTFQPADKAVTEPKSPREFHKAVLSTWPPSTYLLHEPLLHKSASEAALQPLIWCSASFYSTVSYSSPEVFFSTDTGTSRCCRIYRASRRRVPVYPNVRRNHASIHVPMQPAPTPFSSSGALAEGGSRDPGARRPRRPRLPYV